MSGDPGGEPRPRDVSRETPPAPDVAQGVFPSGRLSLAEAYAARLADDGVTRGLIGPREVDRLWDRHLLNSATVADLVPADARVCDVGSGAGLPGIVLAIRRPDLEVTLLEPLLRRATFLEEVVDDLGLDRVTVRRGRAEELHGQATFDVVTARAVAPLDRLLRWCMPLVAPDGQLLALKGSSAPAEVDDAAPVLRRLGCRRPEVLTLGGETLSRPTWAVRVAWADPGQVTLAGAAGEVPARRAAKARRRRRE